MIGSILFSLLAILPFTHDAKKGEGVAEAYQKNLVYVFTGSDWADAAPILDRNWEGHEDFVIVQVDFPEVNIQPMEAVAHNFALKEKLGVNHFPSMVMMNPEGEVVARFDRADRKGLLDSQEMIGTFKLALSKGEGDWRRLYSEAKALGSDFYVEAFIDRGAESDPYLALEKYARLLKSGSKEADGVKKKALALEGKGDTWVERQIAMLHYQMKQQVDELIAYTEKEGAKDAELWKVQLVLAQHFMEEKKKAEAEKYLSPCVAKAPKEALSEIQEGIRRL